MCTTITFAHDIEGANSDGKTIYYKYNSDRSSVYVTYQGKYYNSYSNEYLGKIVIPETVGKTYSVTSIGPFAFRNCSGLTSVTIPNSVTSIDDLAFYGCSGLTSVTIPNSVTSIGEQAFRGCLGLTSVTIPNSVTSIGYSAFSGCSGLKSLTIGNSVTTIGTAAFSYCRGLTSVTIPNSVTSIPNYLFSGCSGLTSVTIPNSVTSIGDYAFENCSGLTSVTIPNRVTSIGSNAFSGCSGLTSVTIPNSVTSIDSEAFYNTRIKSLTIGSGIQTIASKAFSYSSSDDGDANGAKPVKVIWLANTPPSGYKNAGGTINYVPNDSYSGLSNTKIYPFLGSVFEVDGIKYVPVSPSEHTCAVIDYAYNEPAENINIVIPETVTYSGKTYSVTSIGNGAFYGCSNLRSVTIPNSVTSIDSKAFYNTRIKSLTIGTGIRTIAANAFSYESSTYGAKPEKVIWLANTPPSGYSSIGGKINYVPNDSYSGLSNTKIYPFLSSVFEVDGIKYVPVSPSKRTCYAIDCVYNESAENTKIGNTVTYKNVTMTVKNVGDSICYGNTYIKTLEYNFDGPIGSYAFSDCSGLKSVTIGNSVTSIGNYAFSYCSGLKSVTIGNSVTSIGSSAFRGCSGLTSVTLPNSVTSIGDYAFRGCSGLTSVTLPNSVTSIGDYAFDGCLSLTSVTIPNSVTSISYSAFYGCSGLTSVTIPNSVTSIGSYAFKNCSGLKKVIVPNIDLKNWCSIKFGNYSANPLYYAHHLYSDENTEITKLVIPDDVTSIPNYVFSGCSGLTSVTIPNSVTTISSSAFEGCSGLTSITWNAKNYPAFSSYSDNPFQSIRTQITEFITGNEVTSIFKYMCYGMNKLKTVTIGNSVTSIGSSAFYGCSGLTSVTIPNRVTSIGDRAFYGCSGLTSVIIGNSVTRICSYAFYNTRIKSLTIGTGIQTIASDAFSYKYSDYGAKPVKVIWLSNTPPSKYGEVGGTVNYVPNDSYSGLSNTKIYPFLGSVFEVDGIKYVPVSPSEHTCAVIDYAYNEPAENINIVIPETVTYGGKTYSVTSIGNGAFYGRSDLTSVTIGNNVTSIGSYAFSGCSGLKKVIVPDIKNWCSIEFSSSTDNPLYYVHHLYSDENTEIKKLVIPDGVTYISNYVFYGCSDLTSVTIPNSVTSIGSSAFYNCSGLQKVIVPDIKNWCSIKFGNLTANPLYYAHHLYSDKNTEITKLVIPNSVTSIGNYAFSGCSGLTSVTIPNSVTSIGSSAFSGCSGLKKVIVPDIKTWCSIEFGGYSANPLYYAHHLYSDENTQITKLVIPDGVTSIGGYAFYDCDGLTSVTIPNSVTSIGSSAFNSCSGLNSVIIPNSVTSIGSGAFEYCSGLTSVTIPNSVTSIGSSAFSGCSGLTSVTIPNSVTSIGSNAFNSCSGLNSVTIGNSVTSIGSTIFSGCSSLTSVRFENSKDNTPIVLENNKVFSDSPLDELYIGRKLSYTKISSAGYSPFYRNTTLRSVKFTDKETEISDYEFYGCTNLTDVSMGDGVKSIGAYAFSGCSSLEHFTCGRQLKSIGKEAFSDCTSMTKFRTRAAVPPTCGAQALDDINKWECTLYVPTESIDDYQAADQWKNFFFIEKFNLQGDSNGDDVVNAKDYSGVASHIMGDTPATFDAETSDVDENGDIDVRDYVGIANIISTGSIYGGTNNNAKAAMSKGSAMPATDESDAENVIYVENVSGSKNSQVELSVCMKNASDIRGFQFDLYLPEGVTIANNAKASLSSDRLAAGDAHTLMVNEVSDGAVRFLCSSMNDESFAGGDGEIATLTVNIADNVANGDYDVVVKNAIMTETDISRSYEADNIKSTLTVLDQTGVETVTADNERRDGTIYTVGGQLVGKKATTSQLRKGVYIRNGKKIVVK